MKPQHQRKNGKQQHVKKPETALLNSKVSYRWVEAITIGENLVSKHTRVVHAFDREGDITEVFAQVRQLQHTGVVVRAAHNRSLDSDSERMPVKAGSATHQF